MRVLIPFLLAFACAHAPDTNRLSSSDSDTESHPGFFMSAFRDIGRYLAGGENSIESDVDELKASIDELFSRSDVFGIQELSNQSPYIAKADKTYVYRQQAPTLVSKTINSWSHPKIQAVLVKMHALQVRLLSETPAVTPSSKSGGAILNAIGRYMEALARLNKLYVEIAHQSATSQYSWGQLDVLNPILHKQYASPLLFKVAYPARHLTGVRVSQKQQDDAINEIKKIRTALQKLVSGPSGTDAQAIVGQLGDAALSPLIKPELVQVSMGMEERFILEYMSMSKPKAETEYASLVQLQAVREMLVNTWALNRLSYNKSTNPIINSCSANALSFRPGSAGNIDLSPYGFSLWSADKYYNIIPYSYEKLILASAGMPIGDRDFYRSLVKALALDKKAPAKVKEAIINDRGWQSDTPESIEAYYDSLLDSSNYIDQLILQEESAWQAKQAFIAQSVFMNDTLVPADIAERVAEDFFKIRQEAVIDNVYLLTAPDALLSAKEKQQAWSYLRQKVISVREDWIAKRKAELTPILEAELDATAQIKRKRSDKWASIKNVLDGSNAIRAAAVERYVDANQTVPAALRINPWDPDTLADLVYAEAQQYSHYGLTYTLQNNREMGQAVRDFFTRISDKFMVSANKIESPTTDSLSQALWKAVQDEVRAIHKQYPYSQMEWDHAQLMLKYKLDNQVKADATFVYVDRWRKVPDINYLKDADVAEYEKALDQMFGSKINGTGNLQGALAFSPGANRQVPDLSNFVATKWEWQSADEGSHARFSLNEVFFEMAKILGFTESEMKGTQVIATPKFANSTFAQSFLSAKFTNIALMSQPLLNIRIYKTVPNSKKPVALSTLARLGEVAISTAGVVNPKAIDPVLDLALAQAKVGMNLSTGASRLATYCSADPANYKTDKNFRTLFDQTEFLRNGLISGSVEDADAKKNLYRLDRGLFKGVHPFKYFWETYVEPILGIVFMFVMAVAIIGFCVGTGGAGLIAIPAWITAVSAVINTSLVTAALVLGSLAYRLNSQLLEVPAQLKVQQRLVASDLIFNNELQLAKKIQFDNYDRLAEKKAENKKAATWTIAMAPLDLLWSGSIIRGLAKAKGFIGAANMEKVLKVKTKPFGKGVKTDPWADYTERWGVMKGGYKKIADEIRVLKFRLPMYQPYSKVQLDAAVEVAMYQKLKDLAKIRYPQGSVIMGELTPELKVFADYLGEIDNSIEVLWVAMTKGKGAQKITAFLDKIDGLVNDLVVNKGMNYDDVMKILNSEGEALDIPIGFIAELSKGTKEFINAGKATKATDAFRVNWQTMFALSQKVELGEEFSTAAGQVAFLERVLNFKEENIRYLENLKSGRLGGTTGSEMATLTGGESANFNTIFSSWVGENQANMDLIHNLTLNQSLGKMIKGTLGMNESISWQMRGAIMKAKEIQTTIRPVESITVPRANNGMEIVPTH